MDSSKKRGTKEPSFLRTAIVEEVARLYCTTVNAVEADISAMPIAKEQLQQFCEAMEAAGY